MLLLAPPKISRLSFSTRSIIGVRCRALAGRAASAGRFFAFGCFFGSGARTGSCGPTSSLLLLALPASFFAAFLNAISMARAMGLVMRAVIQLSEMSSM